MKRFRITLIAVLLTLGAAEVISAECPESDPRGTAVFQRFDQSVRQIYSPPIGFRQQDKFQFGMAYGHALDRLRAAIDGDRMRDAQYECVYIGLQSLISDTFGFEPGRYVWEVATTAAAGRLDVLVAEQLGVRDKSPLTSVFARTKGRSNSNNNGNKSSRLPTFAELQGRVPDLTSLGAVGDFDRVCYGDTEQAGQRFGTDFGTLGVWKVGRCADQTCTDQGGPVAAGRLNICGRGLVEIHNGGITYVGQFDGTSFSGYWYGGPSCWHAMGPGRYQCQQPLFGERCWGEISFQLVEFVPDAIRDTGAKNGQVALGYSNRCGLSGKNKRDGQRWAYFDGPYFFWAVQQGHK